MSSLHVTVVFLLATFIFTLAQPTSKPTAAPVATPQVFDVLAFNFTENLTYSSEPIPEEGYLDYIRNAIHVDGEEMVVFDHIRKYAVPGARISLEKTYNQFVNKTKITVFEVYTNETAVNHGQVSVVAGGVGKDFVKLHFLSELSNDLEYYVKIFCV